MKDSSVELQAKVYLFDLNNCAKEYWFKDDEEWDLCMASGAEKIEFERRYHPTVSKKAFPETLIQIRRLITPNLKINNADFIKPWNTEETSNKPEFLIAFNRNRTR